MARNLSIPRASATQGGYLSKEDFILFSSGGTAVAVTSFNTRTGEVILLEDDVLAALGYVPTTQVRPFVLNAGDTMSGPLLLPSGDPPADAAATHKQYVDTLVETSVAAGGAIGSYKMKTGTTAADPGNGKIAFNTTAQSDATEIYVSKVTDNNFDATGIWLRVEVGRRVVIQQRTDSSSVARYTITSIQDSLQFITLHVTPVDSHGFPLSNNTPLAVSIAPITDQFVPIYGGTMTGPLTLSGPPTSTLHAVTKAYADSLTVGGPSGPSGTPVTTTMPGQWMASSFNIAGSDKTFTGTILAGSLNTLTLTATSDFKPGQGVFITGAGSNAGIPGAHVSLISAIDATKKIITLSTPATVAVSGKNVQHDDTANMQTAINYVYNQGGGIILLPPGQYRLNGPLNSIGSLLTFPYGSPTGSINITVGLVGTAPVSAPNFWSAPAAVYGALIQTDVHSPTGAMMRVGTYAEQSSANNISIILEDITFRTYPDPQISGLDFAMASNIFVKQIIVDTGMDMQTAPQPSNVDGIAFRAPRDTVSSTGHQVENLYVQNYYTGLIFTEQMVCIKAFAMKCVVGMRWDFSFHPAYAHVVVYQCPTSVYYVGNRTPPITGPGSFTDAFYDIERDYQMGKWWSVEAGNPLCLGDFYDPTNSAGGFTRYIIVQTMSGAKQTPFNTVGCGNMAFQDLSWYGTHLPALFLAGKPVSVGLPDTGGGGYRVLRVPN